VSRSLPRTLVLDPSPIISSVEDLLREELVEEVLIRRALSNLFLSIFNYWSAKKYESGEEGKGPCRDSWSYGVFIKEMMQKGLYAEIVYLYAYRVAVDHYTLNPTVVYLYECRKNIPCHITVSTLKRAVECAKELYKTLRQS